MELLQFGTQVVVECTDEEDKVWTVYDAGPKTVRCPLVFLPPASGTADVFFKQILALSSLGYRVMSVSTLLLNASVHMLCDFSLRSVPPFCPSLTGVRCTLNYHLSFLL